MAKIQVYDPPMCCSNGVCGPNVDPDLVRFSHDLDWLQRQGVEVERFNLSSHPAAYARNEVVREALSKEGSACLPLILMDGTIVSRGAYPSRSDMMAFTGIGMEVKKADENAISETPSSKTTSKIWKDLESLRDLNWSAQSEDAVFIFIPGRKNDWVPGQTNAAVLAVQKTLKTNNIKLGLYTLPVHSPDYSSLSMQVQAPAILIASKGRGIAAVTGEVTESKLLQAFTASMNAGSCCAGGCGPSGCN
ncbi:MAG TPA: arsenite efflux transporter metallochaperone ArsD [bacterium]|nr:arsenite efflux transporter metallochaperone ArsD [bacterium]